MPGTIQEAVNESSAWWSPLTDWATELAPRAGWVLGVELVRGGLLLLVVAVAIRAAGGVRARYRILGAGVVLALLLPLAGTSPGVWRVGVPYEMGRGGTATQAVEPSRASVVEPIAVYRGTLASDAAPAVMLRSAGQESVLAPVSSTVARAPAVAVADPARGFEVLGWSIGDVRALGDEAMGLANAAAAQPLTWIGLWLGGVVGVLLWGVVGVLRLGAIARAAQPADDRWVLEAERAMKRLGIRRVVRVVVSGSVPVPMTWGVWRPIVVVPTAGDAWDAERRRVVLTHELVHVKRLDWALQVAAWVVVSLHWCNPLAWWAVRRLAVERERSCDAAVVACGTRPSAYASHLLDIARAMSDVRSPVHALGMAKASELEGRLMSILNGTRRGAKRSVGAAVLVMFAGLAAAAVAPQAIPPEKQAELDRREAELAQLEAQLAQKRAALEQARVEAEVAEVDARDKEEAAARAEYEGQLRRTEPRGAIVAREARSVRGARGVTVVGEPRAPRAPRPARVVGVRPVEAGPETGMLLSLEPRLAVIGEPTPPSAPEPATVVSGKLSRVHSGVLRRWSELSQDKAALAKKLSEYKLIENPELAGALRKLDTISVELDGKAEKLELIEGKLEPYQAKLQARLETLEPQQMHLQELQERLHAEMSAVQHQAHEWQDDQAAIGQELKQREMEIRDRIAAVGSEIEQAARKGDIGQLRELEGLITQLVDERDGIAHEAMALADQVRQNEDQFRGQSDQQRAQIEKKVRREMERVQAEMERTHVGMEDLHHGMEGVQQEMEGVHVEMEAVHQKMEGVHEKIEKIIREVVREIIAESLAEQGLGTDNPKAQKVISLAKSAMGSRMMMTGTDEAEMVHITDPTEHFLKMREAIARAEAEGDLKLSEAVEKKLEAALKRAAERSEVLRFRVDEHHDDDN